MSHLKSLLLAVTFMLPGAAFCAPPTYKIALEVKGHGVYNAINTQTVEELISQYEAEHLPHPRVYAREAKVAVKALIANPYISKTALLKEMGADPREVSILSIVVWSSDFNKQGIPGYALREDIGPRKWPDNSKEQP